MVCGFVRLLIFSLIAFASVFLMRSDALACSVCLPGDPNFSNSGTTSQSQGDWSFFAEYRNWEKLSGELPHGEEGLAALRGFVLTEAPGTSRAFMPIRGQAAAVLQSQR